MTVYVDIGVEHMKQSHKAVIDILGYPLGVSTFGENNEQ